MKIKVKHNRYIHRNEQYLLPLFEWNRGYVCLCVHGFNYMIMW